MSATAPPVPRQTEALRRALELGAPDLLDAVGDRLGLLVDCLNASGVFLADAAAVAAALHESWVYCGYDREGARTCHGGDERHARKAAPVTAALREYWSRT